MLGGGNKAIDNSNQELTGRTDVKYALILVGAFLVLIGAAWIGQGTGHFPYPAGNIMNNNMVWAYRGTGMLVLGAFLIVLSRKGGKK